MKSILNRFLSLVFLVFVSSITFAQETKEKNNDVLGVVLEGGLTNLQDAKGILGIQFKNELSVRWAKANLTLEAFDSKGKSISQSTTVIDFDRLKAGYQFVGVEWQVDLQPADFLRVKITSKTGEKLLTKDFKQGSGIAIVY